MSRITIAGRSMMLFLLMGLAGKLGGGWSGGGRRSGLQGLQLGFGEQGAQDLPVVLAERDGPVEVGGHALELAEVVQAQAVAGALPGLAGLRADHGGGLADGLLGGVESPGGVLDGVGGGPVAAVGELAELAVGDAVVVHGFLLFIPEAGGSGGEGAGGGAADRVDGVGGVGGLGDLAVGEAAPAGVALGGEDDDA